MNGPTPRTLSANGTRFAYREMGAGHPVLLLHGWPTSSYLWRNIMPHLAAAGLRALALDLPGFGRTTAPPDSSLSFRFYERSIETFLDALGLTTIDLVVHDAGGPIGLLGEPTSRTGAPRDAAQHPRLS